MKPLLASSISDINIKLLKPQSFSLWKNKCWMRLTKGPSSAPSVEPCLSILSSAEALQDHDLQCNTGRSAYSTPFSKPLQIQCMANASLSHQLRVHCYIVNNLTKTNDRFLPNRAFSGSFLSACQKKLNRDRVFDQLDGFKLHKNQIHDGKCKC